MESSPGHKDTDKTYYNSFWDIHNFLYEESKSILAEFVVWFGRDLISMRLIGACSLSVSRNNLFNTPT